MFFQIIQPAEVLRRYISRYVFVKAEGSTDTMTPPGDDPRFINGKHVQQLLPNYGSSPSHFRMLGIPLTADFSVFFA